MLVPMTLSDLGRGEFFRWISVIMFVLYMGKGIDGRREQT